VIPTEVLGLDALLAIIAASEKEVVAVGERFSHGQVLIEEGQSRPVHIPLRNRARRREGYGDYSEFAVCLSAAHLAYPGILPTNEQIAEQRPQLARALKDLHGTKKIQSYLYPSSRDLVPFVLLLSIATVFNPDTVLKLDWKDVDFNKEQAGRRAVEIIGKKPRGARDLVCLLDPDAGASANLSLEQLLTTLKNICSRLRTCLLGRHANRIFVFANYRGDRCARAFDHMSAKRGVSASHDQFESALALFVRDNQLPYFTLSQIRASVLDLVQFIHGDLETARKVGNHKRPVTTWTHYTSDGIKKRYRERIGQIVIMRERWFETSGVIDPRRLTPDQDKGAATPGFSCLDPFDSPRPLQTRGKLCKDYGGCPSCPLAAAHPANPVCVGQYMALERAIYRSQPEMSASTWLDRWVPVLVDLKALQAHIPDSVLAESRKISIILPNVG
jgi:hypothetical protein